MAERGLYDPKQEIPQANDRRIGPVNKHTEFAAPPATNRKPNTLLHRCISDKGSNGTERRLSACESD
jgi:hypothetical protein